ncbi:hypothetical protein B0H10DRAFT_2288447 [Mycena sp. CBHHK59/15]|nr:hypothetical protein B0H10DRAFT_2288447 [Mycena sp. CBHHK59/15]
MSWPVVVVTGANASSSGRGVGLGICRRLLFQLCLSNPPDSWPQFQTSPRDGDGAEEPPRGDGLTLIMACRSTQRAEVARKELYNDLDAHIAQLRTHSDYDGHADMFRRNLKIEIAYLDLAVLSTVFNFAERMSNQYPYISHLIFNAGVANFTRIDWPACLTQLATNFLSAITAPEFYIQSTGEISVDCLGWLWQSNLFGHYVLFRALEPLLKNTAYPADARVIWSSSLEASPKFYDNADWQLTKTTHSYESVKYQIDLVATTLDRRALQDSTSPRRIRHFVSQPGVCSTKISTNLVVQGGFLDTLKIIAFYIGRFFGSPHHTIITSNAAIAAVHLVLVSISFINFSAKAGLSGSTASPAEPGPVRFGAETDRWGNPRVGITPVKEWKENEAQGELLVERCDGLYKDFSKSKGA